jgi:hypothetical protein
MIYHHISQKNPSKDQFIPAGAEVVTGSSSSDKAARGLAVANVAILLDAATLILMPP